MKKSEIKKAPDNEIMFDYIQTYSQFLLNYNSNRGVKQLERHCAVLEEEIVKRGLLTEEQVKMLQG